MLEKTENNFVPKKVLNDLIKLYHEEKFSNILEKKIQLIYKYPNWNMNNHLHNLVYSVSHLRRYLYRNPYLSNSMDKYNQ